MNHFVFNMAIIAAVHFAVGIWLYYQRTIHRSPIFDSDIIVLLIPIAFAFAGYFWITWLYVFPTRHGIIKYFGVTSIALAATCASTFGIFIFAFNKWGS